MKTIMIIRMEFRNNDLQNMKMGVLATPLDGFYGRGVLRFQTTLNDRQNSFRIFLCQNINNETKIVRIVGTINKEISQLTFLVKTFVLFYFHDYRNILWPVQPLLCNRGINNSVMQLVSG
jgi:hypothetical protein